jgi:hypothetical protein
MSVTLSVRHLLVAMVLAIVLSSTVGYAISTLASPEPAGAQSARASSDAQIVRELRRINNAIGANFKKTSLTGYTFEGFNDLYRAIAESCRAIAGDNRFECPSFTH